MLIAAEREDASTELVNNLEAALNSKTVEVVVAKEKRALMEDRYKKIMEHNKVHITATCNLDPSVSSTRTDRDGLSIEVSGLN